MTDTPLSDDLLIGAEAIAKYIGLPLRAVYHMREKKHPAVKKEPGIGLCARKSDPANLGRQKQ